MPDSNENSEEELDGQEKSDAEVGEENSQGETGGGTEENLSGGKAGDSGDESLRVEALEDSFEAEREKRRQAEEKIEALEEKLEGAQEDESEKVEKLRERVNELEEERDQLREQNREQKISQVVRDEAEKRGVVDTKAARKLIDGDEIEINDDGEVVGVKKEIQRLEDEYKNTMPGLFGEETPPSQTASEETGKTKSSDREETSSGDDEDFGAVVWNDFNSEDDEDHQSRF